MKMLIAGFEKPLAGFLRRGFEAEQYEVDVADDRKIAILLLKRYCYGILILDLDMPNRGGLPVLRHIRKLNGAVPIIVVGAQRRSCKPALAGGANVFVTKPFHFGRLAETVRDLCPSGVTQVRSETKRTSILQEEAV